MNACDCSDCVACEFSAARRRRARRAIVRSIDRSKLVACIFAVTARSEWALRAALEIEGYHSKAA